MDAEKAKEKKAKADKQTKDAKPVRTADPPAETTQP